MHIIIVQTFIELVPEVLKRTPKARVTTFLKLVS